MQPAQAAANRNASNGFRIGVCSARFLPLSIQTYEAARIKIHTGCLSNRTHDVGACVGISAGHVESEAAVVVGGQVEKVGTGGRIARRDAPPWITLQGNAPQEESLLVVVKAKVSLPILRVL